jgi:glycosyltransferase involved in cell wall biosynthesis
MKTIAVVPSYREAGIVGRTVAGLISVESLDRVLVVDDCSDDGTATQAAEAGAEVVVNGRNLGKGGSLNRVLPLLRFDVLLLIDGDLGECSDQARLLLEPVLADEADLAVAAFPPASRKGGFGLAQGAGRFGIGLLTGLEMKSPLSGQRAMSRAVFEGVAPFDKGFGVEVGMTVDASRAGFRVIEVPTEMSHRETGRDIPGFIHRGRQFRDILVSLARRMPGVY